MLVHLRFLDEITTDSLWNTSICIVVATLHIRTSQSSTGSRMGSIACCMVGLMDIRNGTTIRYDEILESPFVTEDVLQQTSATATRFIVQSLIGTHHLTHLCIFDQRLEGRQIGFPQVACADIHQISRMTAPFRTAMYSIMLRTCPSLTVLAFLRTLQTAYDSRTHHTGKVWILTVGLLSSTPSWVAEDVDIWRPERKAVETSHFVARCHQLVPVSTCLRTGSVEYLIHQIRVERSGHTDWFREVSHIPHIGYSVQSLTPPLESFDTQSGNGWRVVQHQLCLLLEGQATTQIHRSRMS